MQELSLPMDCLNILKQAVKKMPEIGELLIPLSQVVEARKKLSIPGSYLAFSTMAKAKSYKKGE